MRRETMDWIQNISCKFMIVTPRINLKKTLTQNRDIEPKSPKRSTLQTRQRQVTTFLV